ncbi:hypothetical protein [Saccharolobus shibatae]|uniref:Cmr7b-like BtrG-like domain-containing protein n=1 Tax=Saccharolobus shibatae TaxID=2286 RepID=A0A8F5C0J7_9CREN|nr:hypothetical protein [Saccharolobus shibatae]QXJ31908.1 hypothetical protein J5U21_01559 [Saccharolobus shibatae]QXJ34914.1 hypothetical protein J5U22_01461 [Saccharolobus shibatae]
MSRSQTTKLVFIPVIDEMTYEFNLRDNKIDSVTIKHKSSMSSSGQQISTFQLVNGKASLYFEIDNNANIIKKFNNIFVLFGVVASINNSKIKMQLTLNPCDYVRGFVFKISDLSQLNNIFDNCVLLEISKKSFAIINRKDDIDNSDKVSGCITQENNTISIYTGNAEIKSVDKQYIQVKNNTQPVDIKQDEWKVFKYLTPKL